MSQWPHGSARRISSELVATTYFTFQTDRGPSGLVRETRDVDSYTLERVNCEGEWVDDPNLARHFADPGDSALTAIDADQAKVLANRYGVTL